MLGRSAELTRNHRGILFLLTLIWGVAAFALNFGVRLVFGMGFEPSAADPLYLTYVVLPLETGLVGAVVAALTVSAYIELVDLKGGASASTVAATFS